MQSSEEVGYHSDHSENHVHFSEDQFQEHEADIVIRPARKAHTLEVHLGFLQFQHVYQVKFNIKDDLGEEVEADPLQNINVKVTDIMPSEDGKGHEITVEFAANKEKMQRENIVLTSASDSTKKLTLAFQARVLGKGKGKPSLKKGIHVIRVEVEEESELSDWQGFG